MAESFLLPIRPSVAQLLAATGGSLLYLSVLAVYRLYFHPIAKFPGSKLAALSQWYEFYYDCILPGQFEFHMQDLHEKYGPVIRINLEELHIQDSDFHDEFYSRAARRDKYEHDAGRLGNNTSLFTTSDHNLHALRRSCLHAMFSRRAISNFQPVILEKIELLCNKIAQYAEGDGNRILTMNYAWAAWAEMSFANTALASATIISRHQISKILFMTHIWP